MSSFPQTCPFHPAGFFKFVDMSGFFTVYLLFLKASAYFSGTEGTKNFTFCKKYLVIILY
jgi:hypothetical protein